MAFKVDQLRAKDVIGDLWRNRDEKQPVGVTYDIRQINFAFTLWRTAFAKGQ